MLSRAAVRASLISVFLKPAACMNTISLCIHSAATTSTANKDIKDSFAKRERELIMTTLIGSVDRMQ